MQTKKKSNCSTVQMKRLHVLLIVNTEREKNFSTLAEMQEHMAEQAASQTKKPANENSEDKEEDDK
jgi:hypothetical protein